MPEVSKRPSFRVFLRNLTYYFHVFFFLLSSRAQQGDCSWQYYFHVFKNIRKLDFFDLSSILGYFHCLNATRSPKRKINGSAARPGQFFWPGCFHKFSLKVFSSWVVKSANFYRMSDLSYLFGASLLLRNEKNRRQGRLTEAFDWAHGVAFSVFAELLPYYEAL